MSATPPPHSDDSANARLTVTEVANPDAPGDSRRPIPPLSSFPNYPVTSAIGVAAAVVTASTFAGWDCDPLLMDARAWDGQIWRLPASALPHIGLLHLAFNLYWHWVFGTAAEAVLGHFRFALIVLLLATGSSAAAAPDSSFKPVS